MIERFRGTLAALLVLLVLLSIFWFSERPTAVPDAVTPDAVFRFDKEDLVAFTIDRPEGTVAMRRSASGQWEASGESWRPNRAMIRRVAHQLHDLTARADVLSDDASSDLERYGLGEGAVEVTLTFADGQSRRFVVGDPNPTGVSHYLQVLDGPQAGRIYVVKKSASDFWRSPLEAFREDRITSFDSDEVVRLEASLDGREIVLVRTEHRKYQQLVPVEQPASRDEVRMMLGRVSALRALTFVADQPGDLAPFGLDAPQARVAVTLSDGATVTLRVGPQRTGDPASEGSSTRLVYLAEDEAVYEVKDGFLDAFRIDDDKLRDRQLVGRHEWDAVAMTVIVEGSPISLTRTSDTWRWEDGAAVAGSTPKRVAGRAAEIEAIAFHDDARPDASGLQYGLMPPWATVRLSFGDGTEALVALGVRWEEEGPPLPAAPDMPVRPGEPPLPPRPQRLARQYARVGEGPIITIDGSLAESIEDLVREHGRKQDRDAEKKPEHL